ncbi:MAG: T9SS C-terminal target domain-containing protein [Calditrichaeota bacterium]|nr:MAG: T9SS C-terminal target domain-containing protein [Calditrichota bacterium]MBL1207044.1 T9SS C-terminal target domain-containing protein [Calditrichota bacterium]NOG46872.1 T9SS type A sorting domain-containing protein [Calditrichota bacterium]
MFTEIFHRINFRNTFLKTGLQRLFWIIIFCMVVQLQLVNAQELVLQDTTIIDNATFLEDSIVAGPNFTIASTGDVILNAENVALVPSLFVIQGGKLQVISGAQPVSIVKEGPHVPDKFVLYQNFPNPFNPNTTIKFDIPKISIIELGVYNILGQKVAVLAKGTYEAGTHKFNFDATLLASGEYVYYLRTDSHTHVGKMNLIK